MDEVTRLTIKIADLMKERDELIDLCQHKNSTIGEVVEMLEEDMEPDGKWQWVQETVIDYIKKREGMDD
jgi:hypothetical protein